MARGEGREHMGVVEDSRRAQMYGKEKWKTYETTYSSKGEEKELCEMFN